MNGIHDLGGMDNFGPVVAEPDEPVFHHDWERAVFANSLAVIGARYFNLDEIRRATEWMPPADYLRASYYETWLFALSSLLLEKGFLTPEELETGRAQGTGKDAPPPLTSDIAAFVMNNPVPTAVNVDSTPAFAVGTPIRTRNINPLRHTRLPRYARGRRGTIEQVYGAFHLPDANAHGEPDKVQYLYSVRISAREIWGEEASERDAFHLDLFESYLEGA